MALPFGSTAAAGTPDPAAIGAATRSIAWVIDAVLINLVAIIAGVGVTLVVAIFPFPQHHHALWGVVAAVAYVLWFGGYFVGFWITSGQTPGARVMQIGLIARRGGRVAPARAVVRWVGMNAAALTLFVGYLPLLAGRRAFPDWLARTDVIDLPPPQVIPARPRSRRGRSSLSGDFPTRPSGEAGAPPTRRPTYGQRI